MRLCASQLTAMQPLRGSGLRIGVQNRQDPFRFAISRAPHEFNSAEVEFNSALDEFDSSSVTWAEKMSTVLAERRSQD